MQRQLTFARWKLRHSPVGPSVQAAAEQNSVHEFRPISELHPWGALVFYGGPVSGQIVLREHALLQRGLQLGAGDSRRAAAGSAGAFYDASSHSLIDGGVDFYHDAVEGGSVGGHLYRENEGGGAIGFKGGIGRSLKFRNTKV